MVTPSASAAGRSPGSSPPGTAGRAATLGIVQPTPATASASSTADSVRRIMGSGPFRFAGARRVEVSPARADVDEGRRDLIRRRRRLRRLDRPGLDTWAPVPEPGAELAVIPLAVLQ